MNRLTLGPTADNYAVKQFGELRYLRNVSQSNYDELKERSVLFNYIVPSQHLLVQILNSLSIQKDYSLEYLFNIVKAEKNYIAAAYDLSCPNNQGKNQSNVYFSNGYHEHVALMDLDIPYEEYIDKPIDQFTPLIPLYNDCTDITYVPPFQRKFKDKPLTNKFAIFGLDMVELAIGYWKYLNEFAVGSDGVAPSVYNYIGKWPLLNCQMLCNQLALTNILFNRVVYENGSLGNFKFITGQVVCINNSTDIYNALNNLNTQASSNWYNTPSKLFKLLPSLYDLQNGLVYPNYDGSDYSYFYQSGWAFQPAMAKAILLNKVYCYKLYKDINSDISYMVKKFEMSSQNFLACIGDKALRKHLKDFYTYLFETMKK